MTVPAEPVTWRDGRRALRVCPMCAASAARSVLVVGADDFLARAARSVQRRYPI